MKKSFLFILAVLILSCQDKSATTVEKTDEAKDSYNSSNQDEEQGEEDEDANYPCGLEDGNHSATVDYYNPETGYMATYSLDVEVEGCEVTVIYFPKGGWLDSDHITPGELDEDGEVEIEGEEGKTYTVHIDK